MVQAVREYGKTEKDKKRTNTFIIVYVLSICSIIVSPFVGNISIVFAALLFVGVCFLLPNIYSYALLFGLFPFANIFKLSPETMSFLTLCEILLVSKMVVERFAERKSIKRNDVLVLGLILTLLHIILFSKEFDYLSVIKLVVRILIVAYYFNSICCDSDRILSVKMIGYCLSVSMLITMLLSQSSAFMDSVSDYMRIVQYDLSGEIFRNCGLMDDPNYCSLAIMASLTFITVLYYYKLVKFEYWLIAIPLFLLGFTTYSKSYLLVAATFVIVLLLLVLFPKHKPMAIILCIAIGIAIVLIFSGKIEIINRTFARFDSEDITTGRSEINQRYLSYISNNPKVIFFGEGFDVTVLDIVQSAVHHFYIELFFRMGLIGSALFFITVFACFPKKRSKNKFVNYIPVIFIAVMFMALAGLNSYGLFYYILLSGISILQVNGEDNSEEIKTK